MIILGIDPGTATTGYGVIKIPDDILSREFNYDLELIAYGNISTPKEKLMQDRLHMIHNELSSVVEKYKPDQIACEMLFFGANTRTAIMVGQARGVIMLTAAQHNIPFQDYTGLQVKLMVAGSGRADPKNNVVLFYGLDVFVLDGRFRPYGFSFKRKTYIQFFFFFFAGLYLTARKHAL